MLERLGFTGHATFTFPEEMLRFEGAEEEYQMDNDQPTVSVEPETLPASWLEKGLRVPSPPAELDDAKWLAFAEGTGRPIDKWTEYLKDRRRKLTIPDPDRDFQWSRQDFYVIASLTLSNVLFVHQDPSGKLIIDRWIQPPGKTTTTGGQIYMIFWGRRQLLVTRGSKNYRFLTKDLPGDLVAALDGTSPVPEEEARGNEEEIPVLEAPAQEAELEAPEEPEAPVPSVPEAPALAVPAVPVSEAPAPKQSAAEAVVAPVVAGVVDTVAVASEQVAEAAESLVAPVADALKGLVS